MPSSTLSTKKSRSGRASFSDSNYLRQCKISNLPLEIQVKIFAHLKKCELVKAALVCKAWRAVAYDPSLWKDAYFSYRPVQAEKNFSVVFNFLNRASLLHSLTITTLPWSRQNWDQIPPLPFLRHLSLGECPDVREYKRAVKTFLTKCPHIESMMFDCNSQLRDDILVAVSRLKNLKHLCTCRYSCLYVTPAGISKLVRKCSSLETVNIKCIMRANDSLLQAISRNLNNTLKSLYLRSFYFTDAGIEKLQSCKELTTLSIENPNQLTDKSLDYIQNFTKLTKLELLYWRSLTPEGLEHFFLSQSLGNLESLTLQQVKANDVVIVNLVHCCPKLKFLYLQWCTNVTEVGLEAIVDRCRVLEQLELTRLNKVTGMCLRRLPSVGSQLKFLEVTECEKITESVLDNLREQMPLLEVVCKVF